MGIHLTDWSAEHSQYLADNMGCGGSYADIAKTMNEKFHTSYTRNALIGRAARMGLRSTHKQKPRKPRVYIPRVGKPRPVKAPAFEPLDAVQLRCAEIIPDHVSIIDVTGCRYPFGDNSPFTFCNHTQMDGSSYCPGHYHLSRRRAYA